MDERRDDPLLAYIHHARNSDAYRLEGTTERAPNGPFVICVPGIGDVSYSGPEHLRALAVTDKDNVYEPPRMHLGEMIAYPHVGVIAARAMIYLSDVLEDAASRLR